MTQRNKPKLIDYWQAEANMVHEMGKIRTVDLGVGWTYSIQAFILI